jgi:hypothetical protein
MSSRKKSKRSPPPFPWRNHSSNELRHDFLSLRERLENDKPSRTIQKPLVGYKSSNSFFQKERLRIRSQNKPSAIDYWRENHKYVKAYQSNNDLFGKLTFLSFAPAQFSPYVAGMVYKYFMKRVGKSAEEFNVIDAYSGFGDRLVGAMALGVSYRGCDANLRLKEPYEKMMKFFKKEKAEGEGFYEMSFQKSETLPNFPPKNADLFFSSPPFFTDKKSNELVEEYPGTESDYETFMRTSLLPIMHRCLQAGIWVALYIPENMYKDLKDVFGKATTILTFRAKMNNLNGVYSNSNTIYCWKLKSIL